MRCAVWLQAPDDRVHGNVARAVTGAGPAGAVHVDDHQPRAVDAAAQYSTRERSAPPRPDRPAERALGGGGGPSVLVVVVVHHTAKAPGSAPDRDTDCPPDVRRLITRAEVRSAPLADPRIYGAGRQGTAQRRSSASTAHAVAEPSAGPHRDGR